MRSVSVVKFPGTKFAASDRETTVVVLPNDGVEIYSGGDKGPLEVLSYNPRSGRGTYDPGNGERQSGTLENLQENRQAARLVEKAKTILATQHYASPPCEAKKLGEWLRGLWRRSEIPREEMWKNATEGKLVAEVSEFPPFGGAPDEKRAMRASCLRLGKFLATDPDCWNMCYFKSRTDENLGEGLTFSEDAKTGTFDITGASAPGGQTMLSRFAAAVPITEEEARWLARFAPFPMRRFEPLHRNFLRFAAPQTAPLPRPDAKRKSTLGGVAI